MNPRPLRPRLTRRAALSIAGAGAIAVGVAACSPTGITNNGGSGSGPQPSRDASGAESLPLSDVPLGTAIATTVGGQPVVVAQPKAGVVAAFSAICTHQGCIIAPNGLEYDCPCHGSKFDAATGKVLNGPARLPLDKVAATVSGDSIVFG